MRTHRLLTAAVTTSALLVVTTAGPSLAAPDYSLDAKGLEQTVLRAQMPKSLGSWRQNLYFADTKDAPVVCWSAKGEAVQLPAAAMSGGVGYEVSQYVNGGVTVYQYADAAAASAALAALKKVNCPDDAKVGEDGPASAVPAQQSTDYTSAAEDSLVSSITSTQGGVKEVTERRTTQRGLAVVQTVVTVAGPSSGATIR